MDAPWLRVPLQKQRHSADCLAACAAMVLAFIERPVPYESLLDLLDIDPDVGAPASHILKLVALGVVVAYGPGSLEDIAGHLSRGRPCIAFVHTVDLSYWDEATQHAVVVVGMDEDNVFVADPWFDSVPQTVSRLEFQLAWDAMEQTYATLAV